MKFIAVYLLIVCLYDTIIPFMEINKGRKELDCSWWAVFKLGKPASAKYLYSVFANVVAIIFFTIYLMR